MSDYRHGSHTVFSIHLHVVWITQYRHKVLRGAIAERVRDVVREEYRRQSVDRMTSLEPTLRTSAMITMPPSRLKGRLPRQGSPLRLKPAFSGNTLGFSRHPKPPPLGGGLFTIQPFDKSTVLSSHKIIRNLIQPLV